MLFSLADILKDANERYYGVIAANCYSYETARCLIKAAELEKSPLIINIAEGHIANVVKRDTLALEIHDLCEAATVPVCINLDHGFTWELIVTCICKGFTSVMTDNSVYPLDENIARTKKVVDMAHARGVSVEAELGHVGQGNNMGAAEDVLTNVADAKAFADATGVDALAVAVGTAHGEYPKGFVPKLDFDRIKEIKAATKMPLVLHGGSGSGDENLAKAVDCGINKINIFTDGQAAARELIYKTMEEKKDMFPIQIFDVIYDGICEKIRYYMRLFKSSGKADGHIVKTPYVQKWAKNGDL